MVALDRRSSARNKKARIVLLGEAKATNKQRGSADLDRLAHIRDILVAQGWDAGDAKLALFSRYGFGSGFANSADPSTLLVDLPRLHGA